MSKEQIISLITAAIGVRVRIARVGIDCSLSETHDVVIKNFHVVALIPDSIVRSECRRGAAEFHVLYRGVRRNVPFAPDAGNPGIPDDRAANTISHEDCWTIHHEGGVSMTRLVCRRVIYSTACLWA